MSGRLERMFPALSKCRRLTIAHTNILTIENYYWVSTFALIECPRLDGLCARRESQSMPLLLSKYIYSRAHKQNEGREHILLGGRASFVNFNNKSFIGFQWNLIRRRRREQSSSQLNLTGACAPWSRIYSARKRESPKELREEYFSRCDAAVV